ncbi:hypothetical protein TrLO_g6015 [Triparma laevis f. longispina]|uniref:Mannose-P-dolichol utilization defect 1 protein homolog n=1 Tax=Triparma laevis f. longispina TaxID=1714387 RepID=A0A9W7FSL1_9STRA|nr:hypothetical protein TrLO_g6015 [Triparma laevis f. longispina]
MDFLTNYAFGEQADVCLSHIIDFEVLKFVSTGCLKLLIAKGVSTAILLSSLLLKVPTIFNIINLKSTTGLAPASLILEVFLFSNASFYGLRKSFPFSAYGETILQLISSTLILSLHFLYTPSFRTPKNILGISTLYFGYVFMALYVLPIEYAYFLPRMNMPLVIMTRGTQIMENKKNGHTGSLSIITVFMQAFGSFVRIGTTVIQIGLDMNVIFGYCLGCSLNCFVLGQIWFYKEGTREWREPTGKREPTGRRLRSHKEVEEFEEFENFEEFEKVEEIFEEFYEETKVKKEPTKRSTSRSRSVPRSAKKTTPAKKSTPKPTRSTSRGRSTQKSTPAAKKTPATKKSTKKASSVVRAKSATPIREKKDVKKAFDALAKINKVREASKSPSRTPVKKATPARSTRKKTPAK